MLIAQGADLHAKNWRGQTPLGFVLERSCYNILIPETAAIAELLLAAGANTMPYMTKAINHIGMAFELSRADFIHDKIPEVDAGLAKLYELFHVEPVARRQMHDGISLITVTRGAWYEQHDALWWLLVPSKGAAQTMQGEVIRISGRIAREIMDIGSHCWDDFSRKMLYALARYFVEGTPLTRGELEDTTNYVRMLNDGYGNREPEKLMELAVHWVQANPKPIPLDKPDYLHNGVIISVPRQD
jgi:hypothetical protein